MKTAAMYAERITGTLPSNSFTVTSGRMGTLPPEVHVTFRLSTRRHKASSHAISVVTFECSRANNIAEGGRMNDAIDIRGCDGDRRYRPTGPP